MALNTIEEKTEVEGFLAKAVFGGLNLLKDFSHW